MFKFSASHRLYINTLSKEENFSLFDKCSSQNGHGHDYVVEVKVKDKIDDKTGMVTDHLQLENRGKKIIDRLNYRWIDKDIEHFRENQSTVENIGVYLWDEFYEILGKRLSGIKIWENKRSYFEYFEEMQR